MPDAAPDTQWDLIILDCLVIGLIKQIKLTAHFELLAQRFLGDPDTHGSQLMPTPGDRIPDQDVPVETVHRSSAGVRCLGDPVVVIGSPVLVRVAVGQHITDADDEDRRVVLEDRGLALLAGQIGERIGDLLGVEELQFFRDSAHVMLLELL